MTLIHDFIENVSTLHYMQNALVTAIVIGIVSGAVGCFIILRGMSLMGDAISHAVLPGIQRLGLPSPPSWPWGSS